VRHEQGKAVKSNVEHESALGFMSDISNRDMIVLFNTSLERIEVGVPRLRDDESTVAQFYSIIHEDI
jgi:hypothetical protein